MKPSPWRPTPRPAHTGAPRTSVERLVEREVRRLLAQRGPAGETQAWVWPELSHCRAHATTTPFSWFPITPQQSRCTRTRHPSASSQLASVLEVQSKLTCCSRLQVPKGAPPGPRLGELLPAPPPPHHGDLDRGRWVVSLVSSLGPRSRGRTPICHAG